MSISEPIHINDNTFEKFVLSSELPAVVDFWATWCAPCKMISPQINNLAKEYAGQVMFFKIDADNNQEWLKHFDIVSLPTLLFIKNGQLVDRIVGAVPVINIREKVESLLEK